jgi:molybdenum cofactor biosynthesis enzyme MoaA
MRDAIVGRAELLDLARLVPALREAVRDLRVERVVVSGGEPTLVPNLPDLIRGVAATGARCSLCTNALRVDGTFARLLSGAGLSSATVGLDGIGEGYDEFRASPRGFERALRGIRALTGAGIAVTVNVCLHDEILDRAEELADILAGLGLASVSVTSPMMQGRLPAHAAAVAGVTWDSVHAFADTLTAALACPISVRVPRCDQASCPSSRSVFSIDREGRLGGCPDVGAVNVVDLGAPQLLALS